MRAFAAVRGLAARIRAAARKPSRHGGTLLHVCARLHLRCGDAGVWRDKSFPSRLPELGSAWYRHETCGPEGRMRLFRYLVSALVVAGCGRAPSGLSGDPLHDRAAMPAWVEWRAEARSHQPIVIGTVMAPRCLDGALVL